MKELFRRDAISIDSGTHSWQDAIRVVGNMLLDAESIEEGYIQAMIDAVDEIGPYIVIAPHVAIAHAAAGAHVKKDDMVLCVFKQPVVFQCDNDPVHLMIGMCALEPGSHLQQFTALADVLVDDDAWERFKLCENEEELFALANGISAE